MKKVLTILSIMVSVLCGSIFLVSCSKGYDKMYLTVEYLEYDGGKEVWKEIDTDKGTDYYLSESVYSEEENAYLLYLRVNVKGTSKKVDSIFISRSANNSAILESDTVKPDEAFKVWVKNVGSINFTAVPSNGGNDKAVEFGVNVYRKLESVEQNKDCVPAVVVGGNITFGAGNLTNLIKYGPFDSLTGKSATNQTGVNYTLEGVGTLVDDGQKYLIERNFNLNNNYSVGDEKSSILDRDNKTVVSFGMDGERLMLKVARDYPLTTTNNVIKLKATSVYDETKTCDVYVYIVDNFKDKFLVSYNSSAKTDANGGIDVNDNPIDDAITIYDAEITSPYRSVKVYAYASSSIYSFVSEPGMSLNVYVNGKLYDYEKYVDGETQSGEGAEQDLGVKISPAKCDGEIVNGVGLTFEAKSQSEYAIKLELTFSAFDFSGSDTSPMSVLSKEFTLKVESLASGFNIKVDNGQGRTYNQNLLGTPLSLANIYSFYEGLGLPLNIQAVPTSVQNARVKVAFFENYTVTGDLVSGTPITYIQLSKSQNVGVAQDADGWFSLAGDRNVYLKFLEDKDLSGLRSIYMVCSAVCTPDKFQGELIDTKSIYFISKLDIVGSVKNLYVYKNETDAEDDDTLTDALLQADVNNVAYIGISAGVSQVDVDLSLVTVSPNPSNSNSIQFSADGINWSKQITVDKLTKTGANYKLFFKGDRNSNCGFTISSPNGVEKSVKYKFVNVVSGENGVGVEFDKTYVWQSEVSEVVKLYDKSATLNFLALQSNTMARFVVSGDNKNRNIKSLQAYSLTETDVAYNEITYPDGQKYYTEAIQNFSSRAVRVPENQQGENFFVVNANSSGFTSIVLVKVDFYVKRGGVIQEDCKYFLYEIAVYNPASNLSIITDKDSIVYVNDNYKDVARVTFTVNTNSATQRIYFSSASINETINIDYGEAGRERIYGIEVSKGETVDDGFVITGLKWANVNNASRSFVGVSSNQFNIEAVRKFAHGETYIYVDFTIYQFGKPTTKSIRKVVYLGSYTGSEGIVVEGVDLYNNVYLSLQNEEQKTTQITARVSNISATYKDLDFMVYTLDTSTNKLTPYAEDGFVIYLGNDRFKITAKEGGTYQLTLYAKDSYSTELKGYATQFNVIINVSAGTKENPYLIRNLTDFENIAASVENLEKHYRLAGDINLSALNENWWGMDRVFAGTLDGAMSIYDANSKTYIQKQYVLRELTISGVKKMAGNYNASLFSSLTEGAEIKNLMLDRVKFNLTLDNSNTAGILNISALVGENNGTIQNCCVNIISSSITLGETAGRENPYNIGVLVGVNKGTISYNNSQTATNYASMVDCNSSGILKIKVDRDSNNNTENFNINIGGIAGKNVSTISATYKDGSAQALKYLLTGVVNIDFEFGNSQNERPEYVNANIGGAVGMNSGTITGVAITGLIRANDRTNVGGIAGNNISEIIECANYGMVLEGYALSTYTSGRLVYTNVGKLEGDYLLEQNIGGIVGVNSGKVDNVRTLFMAFENEGISISANESYILGVGNVAGVIAKANGITLTRAYVENFIQADKTYNIIGKNVVQNNVTSQANVAGFIAAGTNNKVIIGIVKVNLSAENCTVCEFGANLTLDYVYFIGDILTAKNQTIGDANHTEQDNVYIVENLIYFEDEEQRVTSQKYGNLAKETPTNIGEYSQVAGTDFYAKWVDDTDKVNDGYVNLVYKVGEEGKESYALTIKATEMIVNVDEDYFDDGSHDAFDRFEKYEQGLFIQYNNGKNATAVVYLYQGGDNIHKLVSDENSKGVVEKTIIPTVANGAYSVSIISGLDVADLVGGSTSIKFKKAGRVTLKFTSLFDVEVYDTVDIFVENALNDNVLTISTDKSKLTSVDGNKHSTTAGTHSIINLGLNAVRNNVFDATKVYMKAEIVSAGGMEKYISLNSNTVAQGKGYALGGYEFTANSLPEDVENITVKIKFGIYLDLSAFTLSSGGSLAGLYSGEDTFLDEYTMIISIYNSATAIRMSSDSTVSAGVSASVQITLETGYKNVNDNATLQIVNTIQFDGDSLKTNITGKDTIEVKLEALNQNAKDLVDYVKEKIEKYNETQSLVNQKRVTIWELFDTVVGYKLTSTGYLYQINLTLKDEYKRLNKVGNDGKWKFELTAYAVNNQKVSGKVGIEFVPQQLDTFRLENYAKLSVSLGDDNASVEAEYVSSESASALIIPGASGLIKVYAEKDYAYCDNIRISSETVQIDGNEYFVRFQQMTYNRDRQVYESYAGITTEGTSLALEPVSYIENGVKTYTGVMFVRTILEKIVGIRRVFDITVSATTYDAEGNPVEVTAGISLLSQYQPGVYVSVENALKSEKDYKEIFLVKQGSNNVKIKAKVYGYQFNVVPEDNVEWITDGESADEVKKWGVVSNFISISKSGIEQGDDEAYYITYTLGVASDCTHPFKLAFTMTLMEGGNTLTSNTEQISFYPVPYIINEVNINGVSNGNMEITIGSSKNLTLSWNETKEIEEKINERIKSSLGEDFLKLFHIQRTTSTGNNENVYFDKLTTKENDNQAFVVVGNGDGTYRITALSKANPAPKVYFDLYYGYKYVDGHYEIEFSSVATASASNRIHHEFNLYLTVVSTEDMPRGIYTATDLREMSAGENYILFNDLTLEDWIPLTTQIASLDGNGKVVSIKSFDMAVGTSVDAGLFAQVSAETILKNVVVNIQPYATTLAINDGNTKNSTVRFGFLAGVNNGIIYNCEVISLNSAKSLEIVVGDSYKLVFGGLVGVNNGNIINSRMGTEYFTDVDSTDTGNVSITKKNCGEILIKSSGVMAGLVGENTGIISSSYVANTSIENTQNKGDTEVNRTAGFVATNTGSIAYSYVKGLERSILITRSRATGSRLYASGSGSVAGFVFENTGNIHDCYSNIVCESNSAVASGFVYNTVNGKIIQSYSASTVLSGSVDTALATELPFVGIGLDKSGAQQLLSNNKDNMTDCYYLNDGQEYDTNYIVAEDKYVPIALSLEDFANPSYLNNFAFVNSGSASQQLNGVWTYSTSVDKNKSTYTLGVTSLPELTSANKVARSVRYEPKSDGEINIEELHDYPYANGYDRGSDNNPYIIRNSNEYLAVFKGADNNLKSKSGYIRFVDNITFKNADETNMNIPTRYDYILGDKDGKALTVVDGNGMTIQGVVVNYTEKDEGSIGLFSEIHYSVVKGLNVEYSTGAGTSTAVTAGGLAGKAKDSFFIDINLTSQDSSVDVRAKNVAGGLVGILTGNSGVYNVTSSLSAIVGYGTEVLIGGGYTGEGDLSKLSYVGGLVGIMDVSKATDYINLSRITIDSANLEGNKAGGIAGYLGAKVKASRLSYIVGSGSKIDGLEVAGGIVGENYASISLSQIASNQSTQHEYDNAFAEYINNPDSTKIEGTGYGNLSAVQGAGVVGGFVGINVRGDIDNSLTKASVSTRNQGSLINITGGFVGDMKGGKLTCCYAQNYIDLTSGTCGGLIGRASDTKNLAIDNVTVATWFDKTKVKARIEEGYNVDYTIGSIVNNINLIDTQSTLNYGDYLTKLDINVPNKVSWAQKFDMASLYNLDASTQKEIFESLFILWDTNYWDLDNTNYMPNLKQDSTTSFIKLESVADLKKLNSYPNSNFILMNDINVGEISGSNYVADIEFTGILIGKMQASGVYPSFTNISLAADTGRSVTSGFFKATSKARIANVNFVYNELKLGGDEYANVGGISAEDKNSRFENISINGAIKSINNCKVVSLGSAIGLSKRSTVISCTSSADISVAVGGKPAYIGGLVGTSDGASAIEEDVEEVNTFGSLIRHGSYKGNISIASAYKDSTAYIGGIVGNAEYTTVSDGLLVVDGGSNISIQAEEDKIGSNAKMSAVVGGVAGLVGPVSILNSSATVKTASKMGCTTSTFDVGGIIGKAKSNGVMVTDCYANVNTNIQKTGATSSSAIGGIMARANSVAVEQASGDKISRVYAELNIEHGASGTDGANAIITNIIVGGIVAVANAIEIDSAIAYLNPCSVTFDSYLIGGGFIGQATGNYTISNSLSMGRLLANSQQIENPTLVVLGGMVGLQGVVEEGIIQYNTVTGSIKTSITALTLSTSGIYQGSVISPDDPTDKVSHKVITNAIIGEASQKTNIQNVMYSSDYCLAFDNDETKFDNMPVNYTADILTQITNFTDVSSTLSDATWRKQMGYLPMPRLDDLLVMAGILDAENLGYLDKEGECYNPRMINEISSDTCANSGYNYYILTTDSTIKSSIVKLNGVLMCCDTVVTGTYTLADTVEKHSAISNIVYSAISSSPIKNALIANENYGTIFMCGVEYKDSAISGKFGGIASVNSGNIAYCYNNGDASSVSGNAAGIVNENKEFGSIVYSYFTGVFSTGGLNMSAITNSNAGYIGYCYSAGAAGSPIATSNNGGRYESNYFDYYANFVKTDDYDETMATGLTTQQMQQTGERIAGEVATGGKKGNNYYTALWCDGKTVNYNWLVYGILNVVYDEENGVYENTYNYGYPIHNFTQKVADGGKVVNIGLRAKLTGNGTYKQVDNDFDIIGNKVTDGVSYYDDNSYLIPHFGLLNIMSQMPDTTGKYFELEHDLVMPIDADKVEYYGDVGEWKGIGHNTINSSAFKGVFSSISPSETGEYSLEEIKDREEFRDVKLTKSTPRKITNLTGAPLFFMLDQGAVIANIVLTNSKVNTSPLVHSVGVEDAGEGNQLSALVYNVGISGTVTSCTGQSSISGLINNVSTGYKLYIDSLSLSASIRSPKDSASVMAGLINTNNGSVEISNLKTSEIKFVYSGQSSPTATGIVHNNRQGGSVVINDKSSLKVTMQNSGGTEVNTFSGLANTNEGDILAEEFTIVIGDINQKCTNLAGGVYLMKSGRIGGFKIEFDAEGPEKCRANLFGGAVARLQGGSIGIVQDEKNGITEDLPISITLGKTMAGIYGGVVGVVESGEASEEQVVCSLNNVELDSASKPLEISTLGDDNGIAYGMIIGQMNKELEAINYTVNALDFSVKNGINVGGVVGVASVGRFNFTNEQQSLGEIKGVGNVGGFIGRYTGEESLTFGGNAWVINSTEQFASVSVYVADDIKNEQDRQGFGGIIGYWDSSAVLQAFISSGAKGEETGNNANIIKNSNPVLNNSADTEHFGYYKENGKSIKYVGGVVGYSRASIVGAENIGTVGETATEIDINKNNGLSPFIDNALDNYINLMYVGGVVGYIASNDSASGVRISGCNNAGSVTGAYCVGGIVGYAKDMVSISGLIEEGEDSAEGVVVKGLINVGGVLGFASNEANRTITSFKVTTSVIGIVNVGGVVGGAVNVDIIDIEVVSPLIVGNVNVGGIVGSLDGGKIGLQTVDESVKGEGQTGTEAGETPTETVDTSVIVGKQKVTDENAGEIATKVYGMVHEQSINVEQDGQVEKKYGYFLPVNIGGIAGRINGKEQKVEVDKAETYARVETDRDYEIKAHLGDVANGGKLTVSMITNRVVDTDKVALICKSISAENKIDDYYVVAKMVAYTSMDTGIGGFAGVVSGNYKFTSNSKVYGDVYAEYGVNVGGSVGNAEMPNSGSGVGVVKFPSLPNEQTKAINVAGTLFVGGYIGKINSIQTGGFFDVNTVGYVNIQRYTTEENGEKITGVLAGNCVGGVFGYCMQSLTGVNITHKTIGGTPVSPIKIFNKADDAFGTSYVGCIVGRIDGQISNCSLDEEVCGAERVSNANFQVYIRPVTETPAGEGAEETLTDISDEIIQSYDTFNYGGIAGLVNVPQGSTNADAPFTIEGIHYYAFTVDMVQNMDYSQGTTQYSYDTSGVNDTVSAMAHYVNMSNIDISASKLNSMYDNYLSIAEFMGETEKYKKVYNAMYAENCNPTNETYKGWAKEYTMFRMWARAISQKEEPTGDSVQVIYNAQYVTAVFTDYSVGKVANAGESGLNCSYSNNIIYTVYQPIGQSAMLYCKYGVAEYMESFDPGAVVKVSAGEDEYNFEKSYQVELGNINDFLKETHNGSKLTYGEIIKGFADYKEEKGDYGTIKQMLNYIKGEQVDNVSTWARWGDYPKSVTETYLADKADNGQTSYFWRTGADWSTRLGRDAFWKHIDGADKLGCKKGNGIDKDGAITEDAAEGTAGDNAGNYHYTFGYSYYNLKNYAGNSGDCYFVFKTVYGWTPHGIYDNEYDKIETYVEEDRSAYSNSGSLFEVSGVPVTLKTVVYEGKVSGWTIALIVVGVLLVAAAGVAAVYFTGPTLVALGGLIKNGLAAFTVLHLKDVVIVLGCVAGLTGSITLLVTQIETAALASQDASDTLVAIEDSSLGYLGSSYGRQLAWKDGEELSGMDGVIIVGVEARLEAKANINPSEFIKYAFPEEVYGQYNNLNENEKNSVGSLITNMFGSTESALIETFKVWEVYSCCQSSNITPADFDARVTVNIDKDTTDNTLRGLYALGITQYTVPMYIKVDNEIYVHTGTATGLTQILYQNYAENVEAMKDKGLEEGIDFVNDGGYMYVADSSKFENEIMLPEHETKLNARDGMQSNREISRYQNYKLVSEKADTSKYPQQIQAKEGELTLVEDSSGDINKTLYIVDSAVGEEKKTYCDLKLTITNVSSVVVHGSHGQYETTVGYKYYFTLGDSIFLIECAMSNDWYWKDIIKVDAIEAEAQPINNTKIYLYCSIDKPKDYKLDFTMRYRVAFSTSGVSLDKFGLDYNNYHYEYDKDGTISLPVNYYFYTGGSAFKDYFVENGRLYMLADASELVDKNVSTTLYKLGADGEVKESKEIYFPDLKKNLEDYQYYSISKEVVSYVRDIYTVKDDKLYVKQAKNGFQVIKLGSGTSERTYYVRYITTGTSPEALLNWNYNKYVYHFNDGASGQSWDSKLYTRYRYENNDNNFYNYDELYDEAEATVDDDGKEVKRTKYKLKDLIFNEGADIIFVESVRVSLSAGSNTVVYKKLELDDDHKIRSTSQVVRNIGRIKCLF